MQASRQEGRQAGKQAGTLPEAHLVAARARLWRQPKLCSQVHSRAAAAGGAEAGAGGPGGGAMRSGKV